MGSQGSNQVKAQWTPDNHELFIDLCLEQISRGNKPGAHFTAKGWKNIVDSFHSIADLRYDRIQLKNHWDTTKKQWKIWHDLISNEKMKWDPERRCFGADEIKWDEYLEANPDAAQFRFKELLFADKLDMVFGGTEDSALKQPNHPNKFNCFTGAEPVSRRRKHNYDVADEKAPLTRITKHQFGSPNIIFRLEEPINAETEPQHCYNLVESRSGITVQSQPLKFSYSIEECIKCLDSIEELEQGGELYLFALDIFMKKEYREVFLNLKKSSTRIAWLERLQIVGPPLPLN